MGLFSEIATAINGLSKALLAYQPLVKRFVEAHEDQADALEAISDTLEDLRRSITPPHVATGFRFVLLPGVGKMPQYKFTMEAPKPEDGVVSRRLVVNTVAEDGSITERENVTLPPDAVESPVFTAPHGTTVHATLIDVDDAGLTSAPAETEGLVIDTLAPSQPQGFTFVNVG